jgi:putative phage-type endonuclease
MAENIEQRSEDWFAARCGSLGASQIADAVATLKDGKTPAASSVNLAAKLVIERLTGAQEDSFKSAAMQWGIDQEENAKRVYEAHTGEFVSDVGLYTHPTIKGTHASPDGLVGIDGLVEIKCPNTATHIETIKTKRVAKNYIYQMQWQIACTGRAWCDFVSFDPRMPKHLQLFVQRQERDDKLIEELEGKVQTFLQRVQENLDALNALGGENAL